MKMQKGKRFLQIFLTLLISAVFLAAEVKAAAELDIPLIV